MTELELKFTGGMRAGIWNYTFPFITIVVSSNSIQFKVLGFVKYSFRPEQVIRFEVRKGGLQIFHNIKEYPTFIIFWGSGQKVFDAINKVGFHPSGLGDVYEGEYEQHQYWKVVMIIFLASIVGIAVLLMILTR